MIRETKVNNLVRETKSHRILSKMDLTKQHPQKLLLDLQMHLNTKIKNNLF